MLPLVRVSVSQDTRVRSVMKPVRCHFMDKIVRTIVSVPMVTVIISQETVPDVTQVDLTYHST